jgi:hypothetical protein
MSELCCIREVNLLICVIVICASEALIVNSSMCMPSPRRAPNSPRRLEGGGGVERRTSPYRLKNYACYHVLCD